MLLVLGLLIYGSMAFFLGDPVKDSGMFLLSILMGSIGVSMCFTFISAISMKSGSSSTLMAILSFPIILPILLVLIKLSANALRLIQDSAQLTDFYILLGIDLLLLGLCLLLFPIIWRS
jgi:heme exporter protein B